MRDAASFRSSVISLATMMPRTGLALSIFCNDEIPESPVDYVELPRRNAVGDFLDSWAT
jgi:hypothetical protein